MNDAWVKGLNHFLIHLKNQCNASAYNETTE